MTDEQRAKEAIGRVLLDVYGWTEPDPADMEVTKSILSLTWPNGQPMVGVLDEDQSAPFARVDDPEKPEVGRWYDGYLAGQTDLKELGFKRVLNTEGKK
jgi:hypothetical protein